MPVPASINDLSTTAGSNSPAGSESPATLDDYQRAHAAFIAQLRDGKQVSDALLTAIAALTTANGKFMAFTGADTVAVRDIVGTVSDSGGLPNGALFETGSNANGRYIKLADGTLINLRSVTTTGTATAATAAWPAAFVGDYNIAYGPSSSGLNIINIKYTAKTTTNASFIGVTVTSAPNQSYVAGTADLIAIGHWK